MYEQSQIHNNGLSQCWLLGVPLIIAEDDRYEGRHINHWLVRGQLKFSPGELRGTLSGFSVRAHSQQHTNKVDS